MPEQKELSPAARPVRRLGRSLNTIIQVLLFAIVILAANYLSCTNHGRYDLTEKRDFSLSDLSKKYLNSDAIQKRESSLQIIAIIRRSSPHYTRIYHLLDEYERLGKNAVKLELVDPLRQTDRTLEIEANYGYKYTEDVIIIDGRKETTNKPKDSKAAEGDTANGNTAITDEVAAAAQKQKLSSNVRAVRVSDLYLQNLNREIVAWQDEDVITSALIGAIEGKSRRFYLAADKVNLEANDGDPPWVTLAEMLLLQNIQLVPIRLAEIDSIPEDAEGLALIGPQYDLNEREISMLSDYWNRQQSAVFVTLDPNARLDRLRIFLRSYGITPRRDRIISTKNGQTLANVQAVFSRGTEINSELGGKSTIFEGSSCSLEVRENDDQLLNRRIQPLALVEAASGWWGETRIGEQDAVFNKEEDNPGPLYLSAAVLRGQATSDETSNLVSKMVIVGNTDFLATGKTRPEQADFVKSSINWLVGREDLIGIGPKKLHRHKITILDAHNSFITRVVLIFLPATALLISLIVWNIRRA